MEASPASKAKREPKLYFMKEEKRFVKQGGV